MAEPATRTPLWRVAVRPRMLGLLAVLLAAAAVCGLLGAWQLDRARERGEAAQRQRQAQLSAADPVPLASVLPPQTAFTGDLVGRKVSVTGTYEASGQLAVTGRARDGAAGSLVLTPLRVGSGADAAVLPVVRGWVPAGVTPDEPPAGTVAVVGYLQAGESAGAGVSGTTTDAISPAELLHVWRGPIWSAYVVLASSDPPQAADSAGGPALLGPPTPTQTGPNLQNLLYAIEWFVFAGFAVFIWWRTVLDEAHGRRRAGREAPDTART